MLAAPHDRGTVRAPDVITLFEALDSADNTMMRIGTWNRLPPLEAVTKMPDISSRDSPVHRTRLTLRDLDSALASEVVANLGHFNFFGGTHFVVLLWTSVQVEEKLLEPPKLHGSEPNIGTPFAMQNV